MYPASISAPPATVTLAPGEKKNIRVTATVDPTQLEKVNDPASAEKHNGVARQYLAIDSGRLIFDEGGEAMRLPVQIAPKPVSSMKASSNRVTFLDGAPQAPIHLEDTPVDGGVWVSQVGAYELGAKSGRLPTSKFSAVSSQRVDLQYVGASTNVYTLLEAGEDYDEKGALSIGISTWSNWESLTSPTNIQVAFDTDSDGVANYLLDVAREGGADYPVARLTQYHGIFAVPVSARPINGAWGDVDTNTFDSNVLELPVAIKDLNLDTMSAAKLRYKVTTSSVYEVGTVDSTDWISFNPFSPNLRFSGTQAGSEALFKDSPETGLTVHRASDVSAAEILLLHMHNATGDLSGLKTGEDGGRAEVLRADFAATPKNPGFTDVLVDHPFYEDITWLANRGITSGWPDGSFRPEAAVDRASMAAFFYRMAGSPHFNAPSVSPFKDVPTSHPFYNEVAWMHSVGISKGWDDGTFRPAEPVSRAAMSAFFYRMAGSPAYELPTQQTFKDVDSNHMFAREISWLADQKITTGWQDGTFRPADSTQRAAMAAFLHRYSDNVLDKR